MEPRTQFAAVLHQALVLPEILAERCVHSVLETARCHACVDSCPRDAWVLDDESLGIDTEACDGCGLCAAACPQAAIVHPHEPTIGDWHGRRLAVSGSQSTTGRRCCPVCTRLACVICCDSPVRVSPAW
jgi:Pyruvate/2-oxoacid:ferredoxin oxidoreductase delta subunit